MTFKPCPIDARLAREENRLVCIYSLQLPVNALPKDGMRPDEALPLARFKDNFREARPCLRLVPGDESRRVTLRTKDGTVVLEDAVARFRGVVVPESGAVLTLTLDFQADLGATIAALQQTAFQRQRDTLTLDGLSLSEAAQAGIGEPFAALDRDVHQVLMPGTALTAALGAEANGDFVFDDATVMRLVYREDRAFRARTGSIAWPGELNRPSRTVGAHGRGVTLLAGAAEHVEWAVVLVACELVSAISRLRDIREDATDTLKKAKAVTPPTDMRRSSVTEARRQQADLSRRLGDLEVELSFGVEAYVDTLHVPEIVLQSYRESLARTLRVADGAERTATMLERLKSVLEARRDELAALESRLDADARRAWEVTLTYVTVAAIPLGTLAVKANFHERLVVPALWIGAIVVLGAFRWVVPRLAARGSDR